MAAERLSAIYETIDCMPADVCRIIAAYDARRQHAWSATNLNGVSTASVTTIDGQLATVLSVDEAFDAPWRVFVSESSMADGQSEWTVGFLPQISDESGYIAIGITTAFDNWNNLDDSEAICWSGMTDWLFCMNNSQLQLMHNSETFNRINFDQDKRRPIVILFRVDLAAGIVRARCNVDDGTAVQSDIPVANRTAIDTIRPVVALSGRMSAVVRSGPDLHFPVGGRDLVVASFG